MLKVGVYFFAGLLGLKLGCAFENKNVLLIVADDLRPSIRAYGEKQAYTPNIDELAQSGIVFHRAYAQQALCAPSRNSFLTSRRPDTLRLYDFYNFWRTFSGNFTTLPQYFKDQNYETISIGKIFHPGASSNFTDDYPFSWSEPAWHPSTEIYKNSPVCYTKNGWFNNVVCPVRLTEQPEGTLPDIESVQEAKKFISQRKKNTQPFFLAVGFHKPHIPLKFPSQFLDHHPIENVELPAVRSYPSNLPTVAWSPWNDLRWRDDIANLNLSFPYQPLPDKWAKLICQGYFASVSYIDDLIGQLLNFLKASKLDRNTIVILLGDHGWSLGEHGEWSKFSNFESALRVPLIFRIPQVTFDADDRNHINLGLHSYDLVELVDLFPTLVDLAGLKRIPKCPENSSNVTLCTEGESLVPLIVHKTRRMNAGVFWKKAAFSQYPRPGIIPSKKPNSDEPKLREIKIMGYSIRTKRHRYTEWIEWNSTSFHPDWSNVKGVELYDHEIDPAENLNLYGRPGLEELECSLRNQLRLQFHYCLVQVIDGMSYGIVSGFIIGGVIGVVFVSIFKVPHPRKMPIVMQHAVNNSLFGCAFFGLLQASRFCL